MKAKNKPIRVSTRKQINSMKEHDKRFSENNRHYGITNWAVGTCNHPLDPWIQIHIGYCCIQVKWYIVAVLLMVLSFLAGKAI